MRKSPAAETGRDHPFGGFDDQPVPDRSGLAQGCFQALQDLDDVVVRQAREIVAEQAVDGGVEGGQAADTNPTTRHIA
ncbi:hypothetical protein ACFWDA_18430 [Rhodococcus zopfii]|uniref:hypothetical protein n=1 Tax=Rhodococcus zopfii TaxID=43772 RepID=UPI003667A564